MKRIYFITLCIMAVTFLSSCCKDKHEDNGLAVSLDMQNSPNDSISDIYLWAFDANSVLVAQYHYASTRELGLAVLPLPAGSYKIVAATNIVKPFSFDSKIGTTKLDDFLILLNNASASPSHAHYGVQSVTTEPDCLTRTSILMNRVLAEVRFVIKNVPPEVVSAHAMILNTSKGFYPGISKLSGDTAVADLGKIMPVNGTLSFQPARIMPVVEPPTRADGQDGLKTMLQVDVVYSNGGAIQFLAVSPVIKNGGIYDISVLYSIFRPGIKVGISSINGWSASEPINGEILNPDN